MRRLIVAVESKTRSGQSTLEYVTILCVVLLTTVAIGYIATVRNGFNGYFDRTATLINPTDIAYGVQRLIGGFF